jgi:hypothetical protein
MVNRKSWFWAGRYGSGTCGAKRRAGFKLVYLGWKAAEDILWCARLQCMLVWAG